MENKNKPKGISKSEAKKLKFEEESICLNAGFYHGECEKYFFRLINLDLFPKKVRKNTLSAFDEKRCSSNEIENIPWNQI